MGSLYQWLTQIAVLIFRSTFRIKTSGPLWSSFHIFLGVSRTCLRESQKRSVSTFLMAPIIATRVSHPSPPISLPFAYVLPGSTDPPCISHALQVTVLPCSPQDPSATHGFHEPCLRDHKGLSLTAFSKAALFSVRLCDWSLERVWNDVHYICLTNIIALW